MITSKIDYISRSESEVLLDNMQNIKYKCIVLLMLDAGMRVSEAVSLQLKNFDFKKKTVTVRSLKKKEKNIFRIIPISDRTYQVIAEHLEKSKISLDPESYLFPSYGKTPYLDRKTVWRILKRHGKKLAIDRLHPHTLRHTFATHHLANGSSLAEIKEMLGHSNYDTTLIYASIPTEQLARRVNQVTKKKKSLTSRIYDRIFPKSKPKRINLFFKNEQFTIGRNSELANLSDLAEKGVNVLLLGSIGTGKSHLLENIESSKKTLRLDDTESIKKSLVQILLYLYKNDQNTVLDLIWKDFTLEEIKAKVQRENTAQICSTITSVLKPKEYILLIDDITNITPSAKKALEKLKQTFVIIAGARQIKASDTSFLWDFEKFRLNNLNRSDSMKLIQQMASGLEVENWELFRNHVYEQTNGNPRAITEIIERYRKEPFITNEVVRDIRHSGALPEFDMTYIVMIFLGIVTAMRYASRELDEPALRMIGSVGLILLIVSRPLLKTVRKKFI